MQPSILENCNVQRTLDLIKSTYSVDYINENNNFLFVMFNGSCVIAKLYVNYFSICFNVNCSHQLSILASLTLLEQAKIYDYEMHIHPDFVIATDGVIIQGEDAKKLYIQQIERNTFFTSTRTDPEAAALLRMPVKGQA